jgi:hypothetical protein
MTKLSEKQIEDVFEQHYKELISSDLELIERQYIFKNKRRADLIFLDKDKRKVIVELKRNAVKREDIGQLVEYHGIISNENPRIILIAPIIPQTVKISFEHFGIEYLEFKVDKIAELHENLSKKNIHKKNIPVSEVIAEPLSQKRIIDGNVAFKVTYNDRNWSDVCSPNIAQFNFENRTYCNFQSTYSLNCQSNNYMDLPENEKCIETKVLKNLCFYAGHYLGNKHNFEPKRALHVKLGKIAVFTSRKPGTSESERFIFAIAQINKIKDEIDINRNPYEMFYCNKKTAVIFNDKFYPKYWDYYSNANNPSRKAWNTGLYRYWNDTKVETLLNDLSKNNHLTKSQKTNIKELIDLF